MYVILKCVFFTGVSFRGIKELGRETRVVFSGKNFGSYAEDYHTTETIMLEDYILTYAHWSFSTPLSITPTDSDRYSYQIIVRVTGIGGCVSR